MLASERWKHLAPLLDDAKRAELVHFWHNLDGLFFSSSRNTRLDRSVGWPDSSQGLYALKRKAIIGTLSNGNVRLLVDMVNLYFPYNTCAAIHHRLSRPSTLIFLGMSSSPGNCSVPTSRESVLVRPVWCAHSIPCCSHVPQEPKDVLRSRAPSRNYAREVRDGRGPHLRPALCRFAWPEDCLRASAH